VAHVNLLKQFKTGAGWVMKSIPRKSNGQRDWGALPDGSYFIEWREDGKRMRLPAGRTVSQALEAQRIKLAELAATEVGILQRYKPQRTPEPEPMRLSASIRRYLDQIDTLKKPNTYRKYDAVLTRFDEHFRGRELQQISNEELNDFIIKLRKSGLAANTVLHNVIIIAQFCRRNGRPNLTRDLQLPEAIHFLPKVYTEEQQSRFMEACDPWERTLFSTFLFTGFREQEVMYLFWKDLNPKLRTVRVLSKPDLKFYPKRSEEREVPVPSELAELLERHPVSIDSPFVFPSPTGNREQNFLRRCKLIAERAGLDPEEFDLKTFRSTYATSMLRRGFDVRTVQHWMGHKSLETTMRYLAPAPDVHDRLDLIRVPGARKRENNRKPPSSEGRLGKARRKPGEAS
jgi:integrase/recombinase XerD